MKTHVEKRYAKDADGNFKFTSGGNILTGSGVRTGESGSIWRGFDPTEKHRHWAIPGYLADEMGDDFDDLGILQKLDALYEAGLIEIVEGNAYPTPVRFLHPGDGLPLQDLWTYQPYTEGLLHGDSHGIDGDTAWLGTTDPERLGYPTQKPIGLLARIVLSSCPDGGVVLDPFCGCGTAVHTAQRLNRPWIGIDITHLAISLIEKRLKDAFPGIAYEVHGTPKDFDGAKELAKRDPYQFQWWACSLVNALPFQGKKKGADRGIDGQIYFADAVDGKKVSQRLIVSVKGGENINVSMIRDLKGTMEREKAAIGLFVTLEEPTKPMKVEATSAGFYRGVNGKDYPKVQILTISELLAGHKRAEFPDLSMGNATFKKAKRDRVITEEAPALFDGE